MNFMKVSDPVSGKDAGIIMTLTLGMRSALVFLRTLMLNTALTKTQPLVRLSSHYWSPGRANARVSFNVPLNRKAPE